MVRSLRVQTEFVRVRIDKEKRGWLKKKAKTEKTTLSDIIRALISKEMMNVDS